MLMAREPRRVRDLRAFLGSGWGAVDKDGEPGLSVCRSGGRAGPVAGPDLGEQAVAGRQPQDQVAGVADEPAGDRDQPRAQVAIRPCRRARRDRRGCPARR